MTIPKNPAPRSARQAAGATDTASDCDADDFKPLTAEEAQDLRRRIAPVSPVRVVVGQAIVGAVAASLAWAMTGRASVGWSAGYGSLAVVLPAALLARSIGRGRSPSAALASFALWEIVKLVSTIALLVLAPRAVPQLSWLALLAGMVITMKTYWVALVVRPGSTPRR